MCYPKTPLLQKEIKVGETKGAAARSQKGGRELAGDGRLCVCEEVDGGSSPI